MPSYIHTVHVYRRFDLRPLRLTTGWSEPNAVVSRTLSVYLYTFGNIYLELYLWIIPLYYTFIPLKLYLWKYTEIIPILLYFWNYTFGNILQVVFDLRPARLTTARLYDRFPGNNYYTLNYYTSYRTYDNFCPHIYILYMYIGDSTYDHSDLRPDGRNRTRS